MARKSSNSKKPAKNIKIVSTKAPKFTLGTIWNAFFTVERELGFDKAKHLYVYPENYENNKELACRSFDTKHQVLCEFWIPESFRRYLGSNNGDFKSYQISYLMNGTDSLRTQSLQDELERRALQMFWEYKDYLQIVIENHVKVFTYVKYGTPKDNRKDKHKLYSNDTVASVEKLINEEISDEYKAILKAFKADMLQLILNSEDFLKDERIKLTPFYDIVLDANSDEYERLTILSIFSIFSGPYGSRIENEPYFAKMMYKYIYNENGELKALEQESVTKKVINQEIIRQAGAEWYRKQKKTGNRFSKLIPDRKLIPLAGNMPITVYHKYENENEQPLLDAITNTSEHLYLIGEGGIGKTTALFSIMKSAYDPAPNEEVIIKQIPIFIELSKAYDPDDFINGRSRFIEHSVQKQAQDSLNRKVDWESQLEALFLYPQGNEAEFILLLDGLNEVSRDELEGRTIVTMVIAEIHNIIAEWKNVRVILTSRSQENRLNAGIKSLNLSGIKEENIKWYLEQAGFSNSRIEAINNNQKLMEVLSIPLFLVLYANINEEKELLTRGEILHAFFTQKKGSYSIRNRTDEISKSRAGRPESNASTNTRYRTRKYRTL